MKKNKMMRIASVLLVAVILTTCAISGTFAKYVTSDNGSDSARVAKWGVTVNATSDTAFKSTYTRTGDLKTSVTIGNSVEAANGTDKLVAPGTSGTLTKVSLDGSPEVAVRVSYNADLTLANWEVEGGVYYCPIIITVNGTKYIGNTYANASAFEAEVEGAINGMTAMKEYAPNTDLSPKTDEGVEISWEWEFERGTDIEQTDANDTYLGNQAVSGTAATIKLDMTTTVTQID